ncbi:MAG: hypothetical protein ACKVW3_14510 [Phycisphaerales bacterium]
MKSTQRVGLVALILMAAGAATAQGQCWTDAGAFCFISKPVSINSNPPLYQFHVVQLNGGNNTAGGFENFAVGGTGVWGRTFNNTGVSYAVRGQATSNQGYAGYFQGRGFFGNRVGIGVTQPLGFIDMAAGNDSNANTVPAMAFTYKTGGFRHFLTTRHNGGGLQGNAFDFWTNNSTSAVASVAPGTNNTRIMTIDGTGNVGIGDPNPVAKLHVRRDSTGIGGQFRSWMTNGMYIDDGSDGMYVGTQLLGGDTREAVVAWGDDTDDNLVFRFSLPGAASDPTTEVMRLTGTGFVGVGTGPNSRFHVNNSTTSEPALRVQVEGSSKLTVASNGGVTIGTFNDTPNANGLNVTGTITAGAKPFRIDHPLDPTNKYLQHCAIESTDMMNLYNGNVRTDAAGYATITMPDWFEALNRDFRYQVTVIDPSAPDVCFARVSRQMHDRQFVIKTVPGNLEVSWQVTGIRQDAFANANRIEVELDKTGREKGRYLHPEAFGKRADQGMIDPPAAAPQPAPAATKRTRR